jgi:hypothetical protein
VDHDSRWPQGENLAEVARAQNSNMRLLIDGVSSLLAASRELLKRLQPLEKATPIGRQSAGTIEQSKAKADVPPDATSKY